MTDIEERLRGDLPLLADWLVDHAPEQVAVGGIAPPMARPASPAAGRRRGIAFAAAVLCVAGVGAVVVDRTLDDGSEIDGVIATAPEGFGSWRAMAEAPIPIRSFPVSAWTGSEMIVWAGSTAEGDVPMAFADGAAYDPVTDTWREIPVPGWGHPGLRAAFDGRFLYALAKNGGAFFDTSTDTWTELPTVDDLGFSAAVVADGTLWGLGVAFGESEQRELHIARYDAASVSWQAGPSSGRRHDLVDGGSLGPVPVMWTGESIVAWSSTGPSAAFDPSAGTWSELAPPSPGAGTIVWSTAAMTDVGLTALVSIEVQGEFSTAVAVLDNDEWRWVAEDLPVVDPAETSVAAAGEWMIVLRTEAVPVAVHLPSGAWAEQTEGPLGIGPGAVSAWTGSDLLLWGGTPSEVAPAGRPAGLVWTPQ